jgi:hypothetical protein
VNVHGSENRAMSLAASAAVLKRAAEHIAARP